MVGSALVGRRVDAAALSDGPHLLTQHSSAQPITTAQKNLHTPRIFLRITKFLLST
jgi:hypothetical protein